MPEKTKYEKSTTDIISNDNPGQHGGPGDLAPLGIDDILTPGEPQSHAYLIRRPVPPPSGSSSPYGFVSVRLRALDDQGNTVPQAQVNSELENWQETWTWEVRENDNEIRQACMGRWYAQAECSSALTMFRVTNSEGQQFNQQLPAGKQSLSGEFMMQGFRVDTIKSIALNWVSSLYAGPQSLPVQNFEEWNLVGMQHPATALDRLRLDARCDGVEGNINNTLFYIPKIRMRVSLLD